MKRRVNDGHNVSLDKFTFASPDTPETMPTHTCYWYRDGCDARGKKCINIDSSHIICPVKPEG